MSPELAREVIAHHLRLFGLSSPDEAHGLAILVRPQGEESRRIRDWAGGGGVALVIRPDAAFAGQFGVMEGTQVRRPPLYLRNHAPVPHGGVELKTLHEASRYSHPQGEAMVSSDDGECAWLWLPLGKGGVLFLGTDLAGDLIRFRQGNPGAADARPSEQLWGVAGERPNYLFEEQLKGEDGTRRHADWWAYTLALILANKLGRELDDVLPGGAPGAVVITGDDDQAYLEKYQEQQELLKDCPITYLLHPQTRHSSKTLRAMRKRNRNVDFGIHPDALDAPQRYAERFREQTAWYQGLVGDSPLSVRNHGFLNDGYWGHLEAWLEGEVGISSNLPGLNGQILNGSLLPARMAWKGALSSHWSVLTAIGDGVRFVSGMSDQDAGDLVLQFAEGVRRGGLPGILVVNLHPQNVSETRGMHLAVRKVIESGFVGWNLRQCWEWFQGRDGCGCEPGKAGERQVRSWIVRQWWGSLSRWAGGAGK